MGSGGSANPPDEVSGFGRLGKFCRGILAFAKSIRITSIEFQQEPEAGVQPKAIIQPDASGTKIVLRIPKGGGGGTIDVADSDGNQVDNVELLRFEVTDPDAEDYWRIFDNGGGEAIVKVATTQVTGAVDGAPATLVVVTDGEDWDPV